MIKWYAANKLVLNLDKTIIMKFVTYNSSHSTLHIGYKEKCIQGTVNTKFLGLQIDNHLNWKNRIEQMIPMCMHVCMYVCSKIRNIIQDSNRAGVHTGQCLCSSQKPRQISYLRITNAIHVHGLSLQLHKFVCS